MKIFLSLALILSVVFLNSCSKTDASGCQPASVASEKAQMVAYCTSNSITYTEHTSGLLYEIINQGSAVSATSTSTVSVVYTGKLLNGTTFDATANPIALSLGSVIEGWKIGIPLIKKGGRIKLIIPSALAYSCTGAGNSIPPNTPIFFDVTLTDVK
ncbi:MAG: FKBP-type peptidyl-prolyl cis-trans isomerase [Chitinophagaceae bacterium]|nr:FKBP-type peptidyl-prolyl cis-trans isomerase [Chitinophagaceae bacterium]MDP1764120.1 FKBP-type peptidyl-prolyl cis-trans isomerase [Sediminibacterium sp.]MDP1812478.1 FKBP-type peptidyl-prolyl cis-trans isomerase [Sediminibacterium sp.]MDP3129270.1 FKBP-type peptidyl-prolyl cis-trans isomerase [Sediminibacterium sp.]MDP3667835.1 FKBP-type peptidyl-prolyl cis-trans isomerase [Sediminibacterium sp.]